MILELYGMLGGNMQARLMSILGRCIDAGRIEGEVELGFDLARLFDLDNR
jgi:hypothetical protein